MSITSQKIQRALEKQNYHRLGVNCCGIRLPLDGAAVNSMIDCCSNATKQNTNESRFLIADFHWSGIRSADLRFQNFLPADFADDHSDTAVTDFFAAADAVTEMAHDPIAERDRAGGGKIGEEVESSDFLQSRECNSAADNPRLPRRRGVCGKAVILVFDLAH